jgi:3-oxoadipate enol-lactonase
VSIAMLAADAARVLDDRGLRSAHVLGVSMGAGVALELAIRMPHRVKSLVLVGGGAGGPSTARPGVREAVAVLSAAADTARHRALWPAAVLFSERFRREHPGEVARYVPFFGRHRAAPWVSGWQLVAVACFGRRSALRGVRTPTLVLHGSEDVMSPVANARLLADGIPTAELHVVGGAGHAVPLECPQESADLLLDWVRRQAHADPGAPTRGAVLAERATRPLALHTGTLRNTRDAALAVARLTRKSARADKTTAARPE